MLFPVRRFLCLLCVGGLLTGCAGGYALARNDGVAGASAHAIAWYTPAIHDDRSTLARWREAVGPPFIRTTPSSAPTVSDGITVAAWNTAVGAGDLHAFVRTLRHDAPDRPIVLLLQEVYRRGVAVPRPLSADASFAARLGGAVPGAAGTDIESLAASLDMAAYYVPSMRNGGPESDEDRGNAILSSVPLRGLTAIELPFEKQRRVAVSATVDGVTPGGMPWRLRLVSAHLDNAVPRRAWIGSEYARARQARALVSLLGDGAPTVLGGDFNTWFGFGDQAFVETIAAFPQTPTDDRRASFLDVLRLDHMFLRLAPGWTGRVRLAEERFGSDHAPLVGAISVGPPPAAQAALGYRLLESASSR